MSDADYRFRYYDFHEFQEVPGHPLISSEVARTMMDGIGFSREAMIDVPGRQFEVEKELARFGFKLWLDKGLGAYMAVPYR